MGPFQKYLIFILFCKFLQVKRISELSALLDQGNENRNVRHQEKEASVTKMIFTIVILFIFCNGFESIVWILASQEKISLDLFQDYLRPVADLLMIINSSVNICIYGYFNKKFKEKFTEMYLRHFWKKQNYSTSVTTEYTFNISLNPINASADPTAITKETTQD